MSKLGDFRDLILRKQLSKSEIHRQKWKNYDRVLIYRSNGAAISQLVLDLFHIYMGTHFYQLTEKLLIEDRFPGNVVNAEAMLHIGKSSVISLLIIRFILLLLSIRWLHLSKL